MFEAKQQYGEADLPQGLNPETEIDLHPVLPTVESVESDNISSDVPETGKPKSSEVLKGIIEAAEHNQAIEKLFEMRHEAKDEKNAPGQKKEMASIGKILEEKEKSYAKTVSSNGLDNPARTGWFSRVLHDNSLYGHAIRYGFATAVLAMLSAVLLVALFT